MNKPTRTIEIDEKTAATLDTLAGERGVAVAEVVTELVENEFEWSHASEEELAELDRRWAAIEAGESTVPHEKVASWLKTWGTPGFKPWNEK